MNLLIIGHGRHGKDTVAELFQEEFGLSFRSSSYAAAEIFIFEKLKNQFGYKSIGECYNDRNSSQLMRDLWADLITEYNSEDPTRLAKGILSRNDCYVGMRKARELVACDRKLLFDLKIWVDASKRLPLEASTSMDIDQSYADIILDNNQHDPDLSLLRSKIRRFGRVLF